MDSRPGRTNGRRRLQTVSASVGTDSAASMALWPRPKTAHVTVSFVEERPEGVV